MNEFEPISLSYFACRGRAQPLRDVLSDAGLAFIDDHVQVSGWQHSARRSEIGGIFGSLPTLRWGELEVCETLVIARVLAERLGQRRALGDQRALAQDAICSAMYLDVIGLIGSLLWCDLGYPGADQVATLSRQLPRWLSKLDNAARLLPEHASFFGGDTPAVADFFVFEAFDAVRTVLCAELVRRLEAMLPRLCRLRADLLARPGFAACHTRRPLAFTGRPDEAAVLARLHAGDPARLWPQPG